MKAVIVILVTLLIFFACAVLGYQLAMQSGEVSETPQPAEPTAVVGSEQHNLVIIQVDQLDAEKPRLVSVWFVSLFFLDGTPPRLTFVQLYSPESTNNTALNLERDFALNTSLEPSGGFWRAVRDFEIEWEAYFVVDNTSTQRILEWVNGPGDFVTPFNTTAQAQSLVSQTCQSLTGISTRQAPAFDWAGLAPNHFHSNMRMEIAMSYWDAMTHTDLPVRCEIIPNN